MKITSLDIERFGIWSGLHVRKLSEGLNVFYGPNEAGKTTLMQFVRAMLYGFDGERMRYVQSLPKTDRIFESEPDERTDSAEEHEIASSEVNRILPGGSMSVLCPNGQFTISRSFDSEAAFGQEEILKLASIDGKKQGYHLLRMIVSGVDEPTFNNVFAIGLDEIQKLAVLNDTEAGDMLFRLSIGLDRVSLVEVLKDLTESRNRLVDPSGKTTGLYERLLVQRAKLLEELNQPKLQLREYCRILNEQRQLDRIIDQLQERAGAHQHRERLFETAMRVAPIWDRRDALKSKIEAMGHVIPVEEDALLELETFQEGLEKRRGQITQLKEEYTGVRMELESLEIDETLWKLTPRIEILLEEEPRIIELDQQIVRLESEAEELENALVEEENQIRSGKLTLRTHNPAAQEEARPSVKSRSDETENETEFHSTASPAKLKENREAKRITDNPSREPVLELGDYRIFARQVSRSRAKVRRFKEQYDSLKERTKILNEKVRTELDKRNVEELSDGIERSSEAVTHLRRGQALTQRLGEMMQYRKELDRQNAFLIQNQAIPFWMIASFIALFVLGFALIIATWSFENPTLAVLGVPFCIAALVIPLVMQKNNAKKLEHNQRQLSMLVTQIDHAKQELAAIEARFGGSGTIEARYQNAQQELSALEKLLPVDAQRREATHQYKVVEERLASARDSLSNAVRKWHDWLKAASLPADWTPQQIRDLIERYDVVGDIRRELEFRYESMNQRIRELRHLTERIDSMVKEIGMSFDEGISYIDILNAIRVRMKENDAAVRNRDALRNELKKMRSRRDKMRNSYITYQQKRDKHLAGYGIEKPEELYQLRDRYLESIKFGEQLEQVQRELLAGIGGFCKEETIAEQLDTEHRDSLPNLLRAEQKAMEETQGQLREELESHGRLSEQLSTLANDDSALRKRRELAVLDEKIKDAKRKWRIYAVTCMMLESIRNAYERERQPQTLAEASDFLRRLTRGRYNRVWTPLGEDTLLIDDYREHTLDASWFSRGTREQLFVAIRLALTTSFAQHGSALPMILDDVLVNFDSNRALAAARVLKEVSESGRQIFLFTCHEHICRIFQNLDVPVRILPSFTDEEKKMRILLPKTVLKKRRHKARIEAAKAREEADRIAALEASETSKEETPSEIFGTSETAEERVNFILVPSVPELLLTSQEVITEETTLDVVSPDDET